MTHCEYSFHKTEGNDGFHRKLIINQGIARYSKDDQEIELNVFDQGSLFMLASGIPSLSNAALSADLAIRSVLGFYQNYDPESPQLLWNFLLDAHHSIQQRQRTTDVSSLGTSITVLWIHEQKLTYVNIGNGKLLLKRDGNIEPLNLPQTRAEMARRRGLPAPKNPKQLSQALFFGMLYPEKKRMITINEILDYDTQVFQNKDTFILCSAGFPGQEFLSSGQLVDSAHHRNCDVAICIDKIVR
ncbi:MAG: hypothetical protein CMK59_09075 [Proteobacteria bacterium]|nr:hypothetical protein [Pseudomonadota bacterium]